MMSIPEEKDEVRIDYLAKQITDILSSGQGEEVPNRYHIKAIPALWIEEHATDAEKAEVFKLLYSNMGAYDGITINEIQWVMGQCGVKEFTFTLTADESEYEEDE